MAVTQQQLEVLLAGIGDADGNPYAGYKVFTYEAGTSTKKKTYTDAEAAVEATNPIVLDTAGRANVYGLGIYKLVLAPPTDSDPPVAAIATWNNYELTKGVGTGAETWTGVKTFDDGIKTDTISEETAGAGILADGVKLKDNDAYVDALEEKTSGQGILLETSGGDSTAVKVKDGVFYTDRIDERSSGSGITLTHKLLTVKTDTISEATTDNGVTVDGLNIVNCSAMSIDTDFVKGMVPVVTSSGNFGSIANGASYMPQGANIGVYQFGGTTTGWNIQIQVSATWRLSQGMAGVVYCDGTNVRATNNTGGAETLYYQKF